MGDGRNINVLCEDDEGVSMQMGMGISGLVKGSGYQVPNQVVRLDLATYISVHWQ